MKVRQEKAPKMMSTETLFELPKNLWKAFLAMAGISSDLRWAAFSKQQMMQLEEILHACKFHIDGKSTNKEEFVTCGGVSLQEVDFKTMESKICPGLYFAGEVLDIDGVTGGFNFQSAWTTSWLAGNAISKR
jgi:predicted Rossmann fold flavoprotein